jgi:hypothetical protein
MMGIVLIAAWTAFLGTFLLYLLDARETSKALEKNFLRELQAKDAEIEALKKHINQSNIENALIETSLTLLFGDTEKRSRETHYKTHVITTKITLNHTYVEVWIGDGYSWHEVKNLTHSDILDTTLELEARARQYIDNQTKA